MIPQPISTSVVVRSSGIIGVGITRRTPLRIEVAQNPRSLGVTVNPTQPLIVDVRRGPSGNSVTGLPATSITVAGYQTFGANNLQATLGRLVDQSGLSAQASSAISGGRIVKWISGVGIQYASSGNLADLGVDLSLTLNAASAGDWVTLQRTGLVSEPAWNWTPNLPVFLGLGGLPTQTVPTLPDSKFSLRIGTALSPTLLSLSFSEPLVLA